MKVLSPVTVTPAMLVSSSLAETDHAAWSGSTTYAAAERVIAGHRVWESAQAANVGHDPEADDGTWWLNVGPTNRWAMFDGVVDTASAATGSITVTVVPGAICDAVGLVSAVGADVRVRMLDGATVVYDRTQALDSTPIASWEDYFFADQQLAGELLFDNLPRYLSGAIEVTLTGSGAVSLGVLAIGRLAELGTVETGATAGITDYSRKEADDWGAVSLVPRAYAKRSQQRLALPSSDLRRVQALLAGLRAVPALWIGNDDTDRFAPLVVFGWFKSFSLDLAYRDWAFCTLEIEGLT